MTVVSLNFGFRTWHDKDIIISDAVYLEFDEVESVPLGPANVLDSIDISDGERESMITSDNNFVQPACGYGHQANSSRLHITQSTEDEGVCLYDTHHKGIQDPRATERDQSSHSKPGSTTSVDNYNPILTQSATDSVNVDVPSPHLALAERAMNVTKAMLFPNTHDTDIQDDLLRVENRQRAELGAQIDPEFGGTYIIRGCICRHYSAKERNLRRSLP